MGQSKFRFICEELKQTFTAIAEELKVKDQNGETEVIKLSVTDGENSPFSHTIKDQFSVAQELSVSTSSIKVSLGLSRRVNKTNSDNKVSNKERLEKRIEREIINAITKFNATHDIKTEGPIEAYAESLIANSNAKVDMIFCDLDKFKQINDSYSYDAGDIVIKDFYKILDEKLEQKFNIGNYYLVRLGGEEYIAYILNQNLSKEEFDGFVNGIISSTREHKSNYNGIEINFTASIGYVQGEQGQNLQELKDRAEIAVKSAKRTGRDKCVRFESVRNDGGRVISIEAGIPVIDIGKKAGVVIGDEFDVFHPNYFTGKSEFIQNDGRSDKSYGMMPIIKIGKVKVVFVNDDIAFCEPIPNINFEKDYCLRLVMVSTNSET